MVAPKVWARLLINRQGSKKRKKEKIRAAVARKNFEHAPRHSDVPAVVSMRFFPSFVVAYWWQPSPIQNDTVFLLRLGSDPIVGRAELSGTWQGPGFGS